MVENQQILNTNNAKDMYNYDHSDDESNSYDDKDNNNTSDKFTDSDNNTTSFDLVEPQLLEIITKNIKFIPKKNLIKIIEYLFKSLL